MKQLRWGALMFLFFFFGDGFAEGTEALTNGLYVKIDTPRGVIVAELYPDKAPLTVTNFVGLAEGSLNPRKGSPFFDGLKFHRVVPGFVIQGGDPLGTGEGGPGYTFADEFSPNLHHDRVGVLSMANDGPDTNGSQFFITLAPVNRLNYLHSVFGQVIRGLDVLPRIQAGDTMKVKIIRVGLAASSFRADLAAFRQLMRSHPRVAAASAQAVPHFEDQAKVLPTDPPRAKTFDTKLANFERCTGHKIYARVYPRFSPRDPSQTPETYARAVAKDLGLQNKAALALFFADEQQGYLWMEGEDLALLLGKLSAGTLTERKKTFYERTERAAAEAIAAAARLEGTLTEAQKMKLKIDAFLDGLITLSESEA